MASFVDVTGNPVQTMAFSLDCFLVQVTGRMLIIYFRMFFSLIIPICILVVYFFQYTMINVISHLHLQ
jgi:hypothetical protein